MNEPSSRTTKNNAAAEHRWHLAMNEFGVEITDLEYAVMRLDQSFSRWQSECMAAVTGTTLSGQENALVHVIHMRERPKTIRDLLHMTNRQDVANMQYELRKLIKTGLVEKYGTARTGVYYVTTAEGSRVCEQYARLRETVLLKMAEATAGIKSAAAQATACLEQMERVYESATREVATFHRQR
ncbi:winged helix DNA-binding protein [Paraburkholderia adhaesiva]|uniref:winged helix DNA-binding protein n=1 Tax=Paraburkholderia adhaesiva TaxID=2883244 RepID=UPI001F274921|nr:winged helix DNA-binding protein [Paraburkholderia adhaesiva]